MSLLVKDDNTETFMQQMPIAIERALTMIGSEVQKAAVELSPKDTGLLQNSITFALGGRSPAKTTYTDKKGKQTGRYSGSAPADSKDEYSVYVGTNVEYAAHQELGTYKNKAHPYLKPALQKNSSKVKKILNDELKNG